MVDNPPMYVVFDTKDAEQKFCELHGALCSKAFLHRLNLKSLAGSQAFDAAWTNVFKKYTTELEKCEKRAPGRVWQTMKKFYGAAALVDKCQTVLVMDSESIPFRKDNLTQRMLYFAERPTFYISRWFPDVHGCTYQHTFSLGEPYCGAGVGKRLGFQPPNSSTTAANGDDVLVKFYRQMWFWDQIWPYHPPFVAKMMRHWEQIWQTDFASGFPRLGVTDHGFYGYNWLFFADSMNLHDALAVYINGL